MELVAILATSQTSPANRNLKTIMSTCDAFVADLRAHEEKIIRNSNILVEMASTVEGCKQQCDRLIKFGIQVLIIEKQANRSAKYATTYSPKLSRLCLFFARDRTGYQKSSYLLT